MESTVRFSPAQCRDVEFLRNCAPDTLLKLRREDVTVLDMAIRWGLLYCCEVIVEKCPSLLYHQSDYCTGTILIAVENGHLEITRFLITADTKAASEDLEIGGGEKLINTRLLMMQNSMGETALHIAMKQRKKHKKDESNSEVCKYNEIIQLLVEADRDFDLRSMVNKSGNTCLHIAAIYEDTVTAKLIIETRPNDEYLRMVNNNLRTALHLAAHGKGAAVAQLLIDADHSEELLRMVDSRQKTALHHAAEKGNLGVVKLILEASIDNVHLKMPDHEKNTPLHYAARSGNLEIVNLLIEEEGVFDYYANDEGQTPFIAAMEKAIKDGPGSVSEEICCLLLEKGPNQCTGDMKWKPLHRAIFYNLRDLCMSIVRCCPDCPKAIDPNGETFLHAAANAGNPDLVKYFFESKKTDATYLNIKDEHGNTALHLFATRGNLDVVRLLIEQNLVLEYCANDSGDTPFLIVMDKALKGESGSDWENMYKLLLEKDPSQCAQQAGITLLHRVISAGLDNVAKDIIQLCPERRNDIDSDGRTFLHVAADLGSLDVVMHFLKTQDVDVTILNKKDNDGNTPLHLAVLSKKESTAKCLLYDDRVKKEIENSQREKAIDRITFPYDEKRAGVYSLGFQRDLKDQSAFDLLVAALIATVSFTAGITVPGGYISDGTNRGTAILLKATAFRVFVVSNNIALLFSLYTVFLNFSTRRLLKKGDIYYESKLSTFRTRLTLKTEDVIYQLNAATICTLVAVYAMVVAFITGSYAVLANSDGLALTICANSCVFLILASYAIWTMVLQYWHSQPPVTYTKK